MLTLFLIAAVLFFLGVEYTFLLIIFSIFIYTYPLQSIVLLFIFGLLYWQGKHFKQKLKHYLKERFK